MAHTIDHFAIGTKSLETGVKAMQEILGVTIPAGGKHALMSTHNCVMQTGNDSFFELIAIDPDAPTPNRDRWFTLDSSQTQSKINERPRSLCWVVNTTDLDGVVARSPIDLGEVVDFERGGRTWRLTVPRDGSLPMNGLLPAFIEWSPGPHPSSNQQDLGIKLEAVHLSHPDPTKITEILTALNVDHLATVTKGDAALKIELGTPNGPIILD